MLPFFNLFLVVGLLGLFFILFVSLLLFLTFIRIIILVLALGCLLFNGRWLFRLLLLQLGLILLFTSFSLIFWSLKLKINYLLFSIGFHTNDSKLLSLLGFRSVILSCYFLSLVFFLVYLTIIHVSLC